MFVTPWRPGHSFQPPVYLDANVLVGYVANDHPLYPSCTMIIGELIGTGAPILVSMITLQEAWWGMFNHSYCAVNRQPSSAHFSRSAYRRWRAAAFQNHSHRIEGIGQAVHDWRAAGHSVNVVPDSTTLNPAMTTAAIRYMRDLDLTPDDALHLALAEAHAGTFVTTDRDFRKASGASPSHLEILHVTSRT